MRDRSVHLRQLHLRIQRHPQHRRLYAQHLRITFRTIRMPCPKRISSCRGRRADLSRLSKAAALQVESAAERVRSVCAGYEYLWSVQFGEGSVLLE